MDRSDRTQLTAILGRLQVILCGVIAAEAQEGVRLTEEGLRILNESAALPPVVDRIAIQVAALQAAATIALARAQQQPPSR